MFSCSENLPLASAVVAQDLMAYGWRKLPPLSTNKHPLLFDPEVEATARRTHASAKKRRAEARKQAQQASQSLDMAGQAFERTLRQSTQPKASNVTAGIRMPTTNAGKFDIKSHVMNMITGNQFYGLDNEEPVDHLQKFLQACSLQKITGMTDDELYLYLFRFSLAGKAQLKIIDFKSSQLHILESSFLQKQNIAIMLAESCFDLHKAVGEDFWVSTWCNSMAFEGKQLEGTRITLLKTGERGFDFAIRTPCTPSRWNEFDTEMAMAWEALCNSYCGEAYGSTDFNALENVRDAILRMTYYWYNFMPLSRGSAAVGFVVLLGLCLAANMEFSGSIPEGVQVDWEAILTFSPDSFVESVKKWLYPNMKVTTSWKDYPDVASTLSTTGSVIAALSSYNN
ncbi:suppressor of RPS4-RLD 1-like [Amaranthus tricolor]|uniref:suppressor of RPS4-RLD 1-like n=1 Tax=Amaranthus tricolor TaxID=29722 RepID=UPI0025885E2E|nr:suppressor of RPS4-RLD 1-like [Amaranthus tricolor]